MNKLMTVLLYAALLTACSAKTSEGSFSQDAAGVVVTPASGDAKRVRVNVINEHTVRVTAVPDENLELPASLMVVPSQDHAEFKVEKQAGQVVVSTGAVIAHVALANGVVRVTDAAGQTLTEEAPARGFQNGVSQRFNPATDEAFYGLGQHQNAQMNMNGEDVELSQHNMDIAVPFVVSSRNYGLLWDNTAISRFGNPKPYGLASRDLKIRDASGKEGGFTARYSIKGELKFERVERDVNYQYIKDRFNWPKELLTGKEPPTGSPPNILPDQSVVYEGTIESPHAGVHKFQLYASNYFKLWVNDELKVDRWRQNWNPWYHNFTATLEANKPAKIRIEWIPNDGYIAFLHNDPQPDAELHSLTFTSDAGRAIDYYVTAGTSQDEVIAGYRALTGKAVMLPKWSYGLWQSRQRYETQKALLDVLAEYRKRKIPLDNIVQDWMYWKMDSWGSHEFDKERFPDPKGMVDKVHEQNAHLMISVWPKFYASTANYKELDAAGFMYRKNVEVGALDWVGPGYKSSFYDPYTQAARDMYWRQVDDKLGPLNIDAWWMDATEPDPHSNLDIATLKERIGPTKIGPVDNYFNSYALVHSGAVYDGLRKSKPDRRVFILTRSGTAGIQRHAAAVWSGDITARWDDMYNQISAGVSTGYSGLPNWTFDSGGYAVENRFNGQKVAPADLAEWREQNLRWFQFAAFVPLFRLHGEYPFREIFNLAPSGSPEYDAMVWVDKLRYRLLPYTYTLAADVFHKDGTIMRGVSFDFMDDVAARNLRDEYLFGKAFLVAPVTKYQARSRPVYLPKGADWYDFNAGGLVKGGTTVDAAAPLDRIPLYVRAGSIVPTGVDIQYSAEKPAAPVTLLVFTGADGSFDFYEDDGVSYGYEKGEYSRIPLSYDAAKRTLTIGERKGSFPGLVEERTFNVRWIRDGAKAPADPAAAADATVQYKGAAVTLTE
jgi:alpha-D-xyloside xylohydrolase